MKHHDRRGSRDWAGLGELDAIVVKLFDDLDARRADPIEPPRETAPAEGSGPDAAEDEAAADAAFVGQAVAFLAARANRAALIERILQSLPDATAAGADAEPAERLLSRGGEAG